jgi:chitin disaccharide deacetylase
MKYVVINADDLGISEATNCAIRTAHRHGLVTSASLLVNGPAFEHAVDYAVRPHPRLGIGLHVCLTSGRSILPPARLPDLVDATGRFRHGFTSLLRLLSRPSRSIQLQLESELSAQFERILSIEAPVDHVNGHRHIHMIPALFSILVRLTRSYGCGELRISDEPSPPLRRLFPPSRLWVVTRNLPKKLLLSQLARINRHAADGLGTTRRVFGILDSGFVDRRALAGILVSAGPGVTEIITHPSYDNPVIDGDICANDRKFLQSPERLTELRALLDSELRHTVDRSNLRLVRYRDVQGVRSDAKGETATVESVASDNQ